MPKTQEELDQEALDAFKARWFTSTEAAVFLRLTWPDSIRKVLHDHPEIRREHLGRDLFIPLSALETYAKTKEPRGRKPKGLTRE